MSISSAFIFYRELAAFASLWANLINITITNKSLSSMQSPPHIATVHLIKGWHRSFAACVRIRIRVRLDLGVQEKSCLVQFRITAVPRE